MNMSRANITHSQRSTTLRRRSYSPNVTKGMMAQETRNPKINPNMCAQLSIHGSRPNRKNTAITPTNFNTAISGYFKLGHWWITSTIYAARIPKCEPEGPTSALLGTKIALARLPIMPLPKQMRPILLAPMSFSRSRMSQHWNTRLIHRWNILKKNNVKDNK